MSNVLDVSVTTQLTTGHAGIPLRSTAAQAALLHRDKKCGRALTTAINDMVFDGKIGDRVKLLHMPDDPDPVPVGTCGTVTFINHFPHGHDVRVQIGVAWDNGRSLSCLCPPDFVIKLDNESTAS